MRRCLSAPAARQKPWARASIRLSETICRSLVVAMILRAASRNSGSFRARVIPGAGNSIATKFMSVRSFFDTNVVIYADDKAAPAKQKRALQLLAEHLRSGTGVVSIQVLQEYFVAATQKLRLDAAIARRKTELLAELDV